MHRFPNFSWARAVGRAALLAGATVVFVVLILPAAALGSKRAKAKSSSCVKPASFDLTPTHGRPGDHVELRGKHMDKVSDVWFKRDGGGWTESSSVDHFSDRVIEVEVPDDAVSGPVAAGSSSCDNNYSSHSFNVK